MGLFEAAGIILKKDEHIIRRGRFKGKVPRGVSTEISPAFFSYKTKTKIKWKEREGELILTNRRLVAVPKKFEPLVNLELRRLFGVTMTRENRLQLSLTLGTGKIENMTLKVDGVLEWIEAIRNQLTKEREYETEVGPVSASLKKCPKCGVTFSIEYAYCPSCGVKLEPT